MEEGHSVCLMSSGWKDSGYLMSSGGFPITPTNQPNYCTVEYNFSNFDSDPDPPFDFKTLVLT